MPNTMYTRCELREVPNAGTYSYWYTATVNPKPMSRKQARKAYTAAEDDFYTAKAAIEAAEREAELQRTAMEDARDRMDEAARILAADK